ncbi:phosphoribulokinase/uridine kinase [Xylariales sp. PMI_506]|nr:phosphoribulokinase/uridine kinase [Xylariales sp. PMI_506]
MEDQVNRLVSAAWGQFRNTSDDHRFMIAIAGIPGSGKTTLTKKVTDRLNALHAAENPGSAPIAASVPMDGYHYTRAYLSAMPDPENAHARRGAEFTFDGPSYLKLIQSLRIPISQLTGASVYAPSFDHAVKDPKENDIEIRPDQRILVFEGLYLTLDKEPWRTAAQLMDLRWFVNVDFDVARKRLIKRHVLAGIAKNEEDAARRADENDLVNGKQIIENKVNVDDTITSKEDDEWK